jgi:UDP-N-acetylmuramoyl-tripeptide--D-alanyl-D-alanine ligase
MATPIPRNRARFTVEQIAAATAGAVIRPGGPSVGVSTDSRALDQGAAFVALVGEHFDGHAFLPAARAAGAATLVVSREDASNDASSAVVRVADTRQALGDLAREHRRRWQRAPHPAGARSIVAITGSAGKTTTKTVLASLLEALFPGAILATAGNLNNDVGLPMTLFGLEPEHRFGVLELGTNAPGEIARLADMARPDVAVLTLVAAAHTEKLGSVANVAAEKGALLAALEEDGLAVVNADDPRVMGELVRSKARRRISYGFSPEADYRILQREPSGPLQSKITLARPAGPIDLRYPLLGEAGALAVAAAVAVVEGLLGRAVPEAELERALAELPPSGPGRLAVVPLKDGTVIIDDSYNANPASMRSSIATAMELASREGRRLVLVLGEMRELGAIAASEHAALGQVVARAGAASVIGVGGHAERLVFEAAGAAAPSLFAPDSNRAIPIVLAHVESGDLVLVKGSRGVATERIVEALAAARGGRAEERSTA